MSSSPSAEYENSFATQSILFDVKVTFHNVYIQRRLFHPLPIQIAERISRQKEIVATRSQRDSIALRTFMSVNNVSPSATQQQTKAKFWKTSENLIKWCKNNSWIICERCNGIMRYQMNKKLNVLKTKAYVCTCKSFSTDHIIQPGDLPTALSNLSVEDAELLSFYNKDPGMYKRMKHGYRQKTAGLTCT